MTVEEKKAYVQSGGILVDDYGAVIQLIDGEPMWGDPTNHEAAEYVSLHTWEQDDWMPIDLFFLKVLGIIAPHVGQVVKARQFIESIQAEEDFKKDPSAYTTEKVYSFGDCVECYDGEEYFGAYYYLGEGPRGYVVSITCPANTNARIDGVFTFKHIAPRKQQIPLDQALEILKKHFGKEVDIV